MSQPKKVGLQNQPPKDYEPKVSAQCRAADHGDCTGQAFNARTLEHQKCACPCHKGNTKLS